jgi:hypothetical protein
MRNIEHRTSNAEHQRLGIRTCLHFRSCAVKCVAFPLTPALSLGERENRIQSKLQSSAFGSSHCGQDLPLRSSGVICRSSGHRPAFDLSIGGRPFLPLRGERAGVRGKTASDYNKSRQTSTRSQKHSMFGVRCSMFDVSLIGDSQVSGVQAIGKCVSAKHRLFTPCARPDSLLERRHNCGETCGDRRFESAFTSWLDFVQIRNHPRRDAVSQAREIDELNLNMRK